MVLLIDVLVLHCKSSWKIFILRWTLFYFTKKNSISESLIRKIFFRGAHSKIEKSISIFRRQQEMQFRRVFFSFRSFSFDFIFTVSTHFEKILPSICASQPVTTPAQLLSSVNLSIQ